MVNLWSLMTGSFWPLQGNDQAINHNLCIKMSFHGSSKLCVVGIPPERFFMTDFSFSFHKNKFLLNFLYYKFIEKWRFFFLKHVFSRFWAQKNLKMQKFSRYFFFEKTNYNFVDGPWQDLGVLECPRGSQGLSRPFCEILGFIKSHFRIFYIS